MRGFDDRTRLTRSYHAEGVLNVPLIANRLAARVVAYRDRIAGYIDNTFRGQPEIDYSEVLELPAAQRWFLRILRFDARTSTLKTPGACAPRFAGM